MPMGLFESWHVKQQGRCAIRCKPKDARPFKKKIRMQSQMLKRKRKRALPPPAILNDEEIVTSQELGIPESHTKQWGCHQTAAGKRRKKSLDCRNPDTNNDSCQEGASLDEFIKTTDEIIHDGIQTKFVGDGDGDGDGPQHFPSLSLPRSLHNKDVPLERKIDLAYLFMESLKDQQQSLNLSLPWEKSWMGRPQLVLLLCDWIQSILISSTKQNAAPQISTQNDGCLLARCWVIFKWCLQSEYLERAIFSPNLMRPINCVLIAAISFQDNDRDIHNGFPCISLEHVKPESEMIFPRVLMKEFTEAVEVLFSLHGRYFRPTLDLWASSALAAASLGQRVFSKELPEDDQFVLPKLVCLVLESFTRYLGSHPNPKNVFPVIVEKLLEPLLSLLEVLTGEFNSKERSKNDVAYIWRTRLLGIVEDIFAFGLFHSVHIDGYLNVCKSYSQVESQRIIKANKKAKPASSREHEREVPHAAVGSYHKSLFQKLDYLRKEGKTTALHGIGRLLSIFIRRKKNQGANASHIIGTRKINSSRIFGESQETRNSDKELQDTTHSTGSSTKNDGIAKTSNACESTQTSGEAGVHLNKQEKVMGKPLFNLFVEFMEPLQIDLEKCEGFIDIQESKKFCHMSCVQSTVVAINGLLGVVKDDKIYIPTEDTPGQAHFNYLKRIYSTIFQLGALVLTLCSRVASGADNKVRNGLVERFGSKEQVFGPGLETLAMTTMKNIVLALGYLMEIEYRVAEEELLDLWLLLLSFLALDSCGNNKHRNSPILAPEIIQLGCRIICIYGELRQVDRPLFRLFESIRQFIFCSCNRSMERAHRILFPFIVSLPATISLGAVTSLVCSQEFLNVVGVVFASVPEGQVAQSIRLLKVDVMETLGWMKKPTVQDISREPQVTESQNKAKQDTTVQAEVVGKALSELYMLMLDKSNVTVNNCIPVGNALKEMVISVSPCLDTLLDKATDHAEGLWECILSVITGKMSEDKHGNIKMQLTSLVGGSWILVFIFRLYLSCRSLYRQCIFLMPPNPAKKSSLAMGDTFTAFSGSDWIQEGGNLIGGYFSWIGKPSVSVPTMLLTVSQSLEQDGFERTSALLYVLHNIALQRLVDLNRQLNALAFLHDKTLRLNRAMAEGGDDLPIQCKERKRLEKRIQISKQEASALTDFILKYAFSIVEKVEHKTCTVEIDNTRLWAWNSVVGMLNEHSLVTAIWQLVCNNVDVWSCHASKKSMKKFVSKLLGSFLSILKGNCTDVSFQLVEKRMENELKVVTMEKTSSQLLRNSVLYEQQFFCRYLARKICQKIMKSLPSRLNHFSFLGISSSEAVFGNLQDWSSFKNMLEEIMVARELESSLHENIKKEEHELTLATMRVPQVAMEENQATIYGRRTFGDWIDILNLLCWLPKGYVGVKSLAMYVRHILMIERFLVITFLKVKQVSCHDPLAIQKCVGICHPTEFLDLLLACRRALKSIMLSYNEDEFEVRRSLLPILFESSSSCMWLLRSIDVVAQCFSECALWQPSLKDDLTGDVNPGKHLIFSILDHTSGTLMVICEDFFNIAARSLICDVQCTSDTCRVVRSGNTSQNSNTVTISKKKEHVDVQTLIDALGKTLSFEVRNTVGYLKQSNFETDTCSNQSISTLTSNFEGMSYVTQVLDACKPYCGSWVGVIALTGAIKSIIWGLVSALENLDQQCRNDKTGSLKWKHDLLVKWEPSLEGFVYFINLCINKFLVGDILDEAVTVERDVASHQRNNTTSKQDTDAELLTDYGIAKEMEIGFGQEQDSETEEEKNEEEHTNLDDHMDITDDDEDDGVIDNGDFLEPKSQFLQNDTDLHVFKGTEQWSDLAEIPDLNKSFLEKLLKGEKPDQATLLGELFLALAGVVKLKHLSSSPKVIMSAPNSLSMSLAFMNLQLEAAHWLILEATTMMRHCRVVSLDWLVGIVRFLECIGSYIPYMNQVVPRIVYVKLINLHLEAMATFCFLPSGENKSSISHEVYCNNDNLSPCESTVHDKSSFSKMDSDSLKDLKAAVRSSFAMLVRKPLELHLFLALQSIERALAGVWAGHNNVSELHTGSPYGGRVGRIVAAGVECLDLALESVSGPKRLKLLAKYSSSFVAALINILLHLQGPHIFFGSVLDQGRDGDYVNPALVILACVEILSKLASRHAVFPMNASHVGQSLAFPAVLFQHFCRLKSAQYETPCGMSLPHQQVDCTKATLVGCTFAAERKLSVELFVTCCRLLCALLRHRKRESGHCIALLGDSLRIFLFCLELVDHNRPEKLNANFWTVDEGVKCASWLRRVYEEMGQHKDTLGIYCSHILSDYICVLSGCGPKKSGLKREIDGALRPGIYALVDACSLEDLQQLHAVLGEGPRRSALQALRLDYERHFKYTGKI